MTAVTAVVTVHGVKRSRPAGPGAARGPTRRGVPARRAGRIMPCGNRNLPPVGIRATGTTGGAGVLQGMQQQGWKSDGEGNATMDNCGIDSWPSRCVQQRSTLHDVTVKARETPKGTGNLHEQEAAASSPCRVVGSGPASSAGEWDRPGPATAAAPTGIRVSTPHLPVWGRLTAGVTATTVAGAGRGPPASRCGVRPEPGLARPQARAQWRRGGAAAWAEFGPAAGPGTVEARRGSRRAKFGPAAGRGTVEARRSSRRAKFGPAAGQGTIEARRNSRRASVRQ